MVLANDFDLLSVAVGFASNYPIERVIFDGVVFLHQKVQT